MANSITSAAVQAQRSKEYRDIDLNFIPNPLTGDIVQLKDIEAVKQGVKNIILTKFGEKLFNYTFGSRVNSLLFENYHSLTLAGMKLEIQDALAKYEPRIILEDVRTTSLPETNELIVSIIFLLKNQLDKRVEFQFILTRVR